MTELVEQAAFVGASIYKSRINNTSNNPQIMDFFEDMIKDILIAYQNK